VVPNNGGVLKSVLVVDASVVSRLETCGAVFIFKVVLVAGAIPEIPSLANRIMPEPTRPSYWICTVASAGIEMFSPASAKAQLNTKMITSMAQCITTLGF
jgi:hypothetical protein